MARNRRSKVAISLDSGLLARLERVRAVTGESRSAAISRAIARLTDEESASARSRRYLEAYRERPEPAQTLELARRLARETLAALPWDDTP